MTSRYAPDDEADQLEAAVYRAIALITFTAAPILAVILLELLS